MPSAPGKTQFVSALWPPPTNPDMTSPPGRASHRLTRTMSPGRGGPALKRARTVISVLSYRRRMPIHGRPLNRQQKKPVGASRPGAAPVG